MLPLSLMLVLTSALAGDLSPEELIARLGSPDRVVRAEAARTLEEQGTEALPALRAARESARTPEARERLTDLIGRIESHTLDRPTMVVFDVDDLPLGEAVRSLATRSGFALSLDDPAQANRRVTVRAAGPSPFWEVLDRLGRAGHVRYDPGPRSDRIDNGPRPWTIRLVPGEPPSPTAYSGPLRIHLFATHRHRDVNFALGPGGPGISLKTAPVTVEIQAFAEPGRFIDPNGLPRLEAVDPEGRAISPQPGGGGELPNPSEHSWLIPERISLLHWHIPLGLPERPIRSPLKLRGVLPVVISARRPDPLVVPLVGANGKVFRQGTSVVRVEKGQAGVANTTAWNLFFGEEVSSSNHDLLSADCDKDDTGALLHNRIEFRDALGRPLNWLIIGGSPITTSNGERRLETLVSGASPPAQLHVYRLHRRETEIPFELADVPLP